MLAGMTMNKNKMTADLLWQLGRITALGLSNDKKNIVYKVNTPSVEENQQYTKHYFIPINGGNPTEIENTDSILANKKLSPDGKYLLSHQEVKLQNVLGKDFYPELEKAEVQIYDSLNYRHWDTWNEGKFNHVFYSENKTDAPKTDIMENELFDCPKKYFLATGILAEPIGKKTMPLFKKHIRNSIQ